MEESEYKLNVDRVAIAGVDEGVSPELKKKIDSIIKSWYHSKVSRSGLVC